MTTPTENPTNTESTSSAGAQNTEHMIPKSRLDKEIAEKKALLERLEALENAGKEAESARQAQAQKELAEQNRYKELYEQTLSQLESLKTVQDEAKRYRESFENTLKTRMEQVPEDKRHLIPDFGDPIKTSAWLDKALPDLVTPAKPAPPRLDGGSGNVAQGQSVVLSANQQAITDIARQHGYSVSEERIAQYAKKPIQASNNTGDK